MAAAAERMKAMRARRRADGFREVRLVVPDPRADATRRRLARDVARLSLAAEGEALDWLELVAEFDGTR